MIPAPPFSAAYPGGCCSQQVVEPHYLHHLVVKILENEKLTTRISQGGCSFLFHWPSQTFERLVLKKLS